MSFAFATAERSPVTRTPLDDGARGRRVAMMASHPARVAAVASATPHGPPPTTATVRRLTVAAIARPPSVSTASSCLAEGTMIGQPGPFQESLVAPAQPKDGQLHM